MSRVAEQWDESIEQARADLYDACVVCGEVYETPSESAYCSRGCGLSQQL